jgi:leucyl/phenylalanyl-tRNA---protein transferase
MSGRAPYWLDPEDPQAPFPPVELALREPDGLLAVGGDLAPQRLLRAYGLGIFPWYSAGQPILWWSPDPRMVLRPDQLMISRSLGKTLRNRPFAITTDRAFDAVLDGCAKPRPESSGTWLTPEMRRAYAHLHRLGYAHSVEAWQNGRLVGGLYGVALGRVFFGESMFALVTDASKVAFAHLVRQLARWDFALIDCQVHTAHLASLGAAPVPRSDFTTQLERFAKVPALAAPWQLDVDLGQDSWRR